MSSDLVILIKDLLSPNNNIRKSAETKLNNIFENMTLQDLNGLLNQLIQVKEENIKLYILMIIKKFINEKIDENNYEIFIQFLSNNKINFINLLLSKETSVKLIKNLLDCLFCKIKILKSKDSYINYTYDTFTYLIQYYLNKKQANEINEIIRCLLVCGKYLKYIKEVTVNKKLEDLIKNFYSNIIEDYKIIVSNIINNNLNNILLLESVFYYLKLLKHSNQFMDDSYSDIILNNTYDLNVYILNKLISNEIINDNLISKYIFDIIFFSNKIIILYISQLNTLSTKTLQKFADMFYIYVKEENIFIYISNILKNSENMETKFLSDIINFFYELLQLTSMQEYKEFQIFGNGFTDNAIEVSDYFRNKYFDKDKIKLLILFIIKNYLIFKPKEIMMGQNEPEEFYLWFYNSDAYHYDLRRRGGSICRIIYDIFKKDIKDVYLSIENELYSLTELEYNLINKNQYLNDNQINIRLALLSYYYYVDLHFSSKKIDKHKWIEQILLSQIDPNIIIKKNEIFSTFLTMYVLSKINSYVSDSKTKYTIFLKIMEVFICKNLNYLLLNLSCIDFIYDYLEEELNNIKVPKNLINNYLTKICQILGKVSSPDIHNKIIETTNSLLRKTEDDDLNLNFIEIFPILENIWQNNSIELNQNNNNSNKLILVKSNLIKLIELFVKKIGFFITIDNIENDYNINENNIINNNKNFYENYFNFVYQIIGFSINVNSPSNEFLCKDSLNLMIYIQDYFFNNSSLSMISNINELKNQVSSFYFYPYFIKTYDYLDILLSNLSNSNQYFITQFAAIEQFISLSFEKDIAIRLDNINFIEKIIYIFNYFLDNYANQYSLYIFNVIEYIYYIILSHSKISEENKKKLNDYIYQIIQNKFGDNEFEKKIDGLINQFEQQIDNINYRLYNMNDDSYLFNIYIGILQLVNRYIYVNGIIYKNINNELNIFIAKKIISLSKFLTQKNNVLNIIQKAILQNCIFNIKNLIEENIDRYINNKLNEIYKTIARSHFLSQKDKCLHHWLYFFNKIYNGFSLSTGLENEEENLKYYWESLVEKDVQLIDKVNKEYKIKFLMIQNDLMYLNDN